MVSSMLSYLYQVKCFEYKEIYQPFMNSQQPFYDFIVAAIVDGAWNDHAINN